VRTEGFVVRQDDAELIGKSLRWQSQKFFDVIIILIVWPGHTVHAKCKSGSCEQQESSKSVESNNRRNVPNQTPIPHPSYESPTHEPYILQTSPIHRRQTHLGAQAHTSLVASPEHSNPPPERREDRRLKTEDDRSPNRGIREIHEMKTRMNLTTTSTEITKRESESGFSVFSAFSVVNPASPSSFPSFPSVKEIFLPPSFCLNSDSAFRFSQTEH